MESSGRANDETAVRMQKSRSDLVKSAIESGESSKKTDTGSNHCSASRNTGESNDCDDTHESSESAPVGEYPTSSGTGTNVTNETCSL